MHFWISGCVIESKICFCVLSANTSCASRSRSNVPSLWKNSSPKCLRSFCHARFLGWTTTETNKLKQLPFCLSIWGCNNNNDDLRTVSWPLYTVSQKNPIHLTFNHNVNKVKYRPIYKIISLSDSWENCVHIFPPHLKYVSTLTCES